MPRIRKAAKIILRVTGHMLTIYFGFWLLYETLVWNKPLHQALQTNMLNTTLFFAGLALLAASLLPDGKKQNRKQWFEELEETVKT